MAVPSDQGVLDIGQRSFDRMERVGFVSIDDNAEESSTGFVTLEDYRSAEFGPKDVEIGGYIVGSVRIDVRKVPKSALDKLHQDKLDEERARIQEEGLDHVSKARSKELREQAALTLRAKVPPTIKIVDWFWNQTTGVVFLTDKAKGVIEAFVNLFNSAFGPDHELARVEIGNILPNADGVEFNLGQEFLTWLWGLREKNSAFLVGGMHFSAWIDKKVTISNNHKSLEAKFDDDATEIDLGVRDGLRVSKALIRIEYGEDNERWCTFMLDAGLLPVVEMAIPNTKYTPGSDFAGALLTQIGTIEEAFTRFRLLLISFAVQYRPDVIAPGLTQPQLQEVRETPDTMSQFLEDGQHLLSVREVMFYSKGGAIPDALTEDEAA
jgi:hypothetical protein